MNDSGWDIDAIVGEVLRRLSARKDPAPQPASTQPSNPPDTTSRGELRVCERVVSLAALEGRLGGVRQLVVRPGAVVTPSVKDVLRKRNITVAWDASGAPSPDGVAPFVSIVTETSFDAGPLWARLAGETLPAGSVLEATRLLAERICRGNRLGVLLTGQIAAALCLANRHRGVRAALGAGPQMAREAVSGVGANLLVVDPAGRSLTNLLTTVNEFLRAGPRHCPALYQDQL